MSKATWAYRLPTPHPMKPLMTARKPGVKPSPWHSSHMENYEHIRAGMPQMRSPAGNASAQRKILQQIQVEVQAGRPLWALDAIQGMYYNKVYPLQEHWREVLIGAVRWGEAETARDAWALMERQGFIPDDQTLCCWFEVCAQLKLRDLALQAWNRYCTEFAFLEAGEEDPKPAMRKKHTLTRDDYYNLPWWKKRWSYDPNHDVPDAHRFNRTREVFAAAAGALYACEETELATQLLDVLQHKLLTTPTPIAEPMLDPLIRNGAKAMVKSTNDSFFLNKMRGSTGDLDNKPVRFRIPNIYLFTMRKATRGVDWVPNHEWLMETHQVGPDAPKSSRDSEHGDPRFFSNVQYLLYTLERKMRYAAFDSAAAVLAAAKEVEDLFATDAGISAAERAAVNWEDFTAATLARAATFADGTPEVVADAMYDMCETHALRPSPLMYAHVFTAHTNLPAGDNSEGVREGLRGFMGELRKSKQTLDLQTHRAYIAACVHLDNREAHNYFVKSVLRAYRWGNDEVALLLREYRAVGDDGDVHMQKKYCERVVAWCGRYNIEMSETNKQYIEDDYDRIQVQVRTKEELLVWKMKRQHQLRNSLTPNLPNPVTDRVTHTLDQSDHQNPDHLESWVVPYSNAGRSFSWSYDSPHRPDTGSTRDLTDLDRVRYLPQARILSPWVAKSNYEGGAARYRPERMHEKLTINRWFEETNKSFPGH